MLLITIFVKLRVVAGRSRTRAGSPQAVSRRPCCAHTLTHTQYTQYTLTYTHSHTHTHTHSHTHTLTHTHKPMRHNAIQYLLAQTRYAQQRVGKIPPNAEQAEKNGRLLVQSSWQLAASDTPSTAYIIYIKYTLVNLKRWGMVPVCLCLHVTQFSPQ